MATTSSIRPQTFFFSGAPEHVLAAANAHKATTEAQAAQAASANNARGAANAAAANMMGIQSQQPASMFGSYAPSAANMFQTLGGMYTTGMGAMGQMFDSYSDAFGAYGNAIGNIAGNAAQARANENAGRYAAYAGGLDAYTGMMGNLGSSALAAYGSAANSAMQMAAARETAAMKAMSDMVAANQSAAAQYGVGRDQSLAGIAGAYANAGGSLGAARAGMGNAAANLAGAGSGALANLGTGVANAAANASSGTAQGQAALAAALANALSGVTVGEQNALAQNNAATANALAGILTSAANSQAGIGNATAALGGALGGNITNAAANSLNYTRDMAKLDLARQLGIAGTNVASQGLSNLPGGQNLTALGGGFTISGPQGVIAGGGGVPGVSLTASGSGMSTPPIYLDPNANTPWYSQKQVSDGGAMSQLESLRNQSMGALGALASDVRSGATGGQGQLAGQFDRTAAGIGASSAAGRGQLDTMGGRMGGDIRSAFNTASNRINTEGDSSRAAILAALADGSGTISNQSAGLNADAAAAMGGINQARADVVGSGVLESLNRNFRGGFDSLVSQYQSGRQDPRTLLQDVLSSTQTLSNPYLAAGRDAYGRWMGEFPEPLDPELGGPGFLDPVPYLSALQAGWNPFRNELSNAFYNQNANVLGMLQSGRQDYMSSLGNLTNQYNATSDWARQSALRPTSQREPLAGGTFGGLAIQPLASQARRPIAERLPVGSPFQAVLAGL